MPCRLHFSSQLPSLAPRISQRRVSVPLTVIASDVDDAKINLLREQNLTETAQSLAQALRRRRRRRHRIVDAGGIIAPRRVSSSVRILQW